MFCSSWGGEVFAPQGETGKRQTVRPLMIMWREGVHTAPMVQARAATFRNLANLEWSDVAASFETEESDDGQEEQR